MVAFGFLTILMGFCILMSFIAQVKRFYLVKNP